MDDDWDLPVAPRATTPASPPPKKPAPAPLPSSLGPIDLDEATTPNATPASIDALQQREKVLQQQLEAHADAAHHHANKNRKPLSTDDSVDFGDLLAEARTASVSVPTPPPPPPPPSATRAALLAAADEDDDLELVPSSNSSASAVLVTGASPKEQTELSEETTDAIDHAVFGVLDRTEARRRVDTARILAAYTEEEDDDEDEAPSRSTPNQTTDEAQPADTSPSVDSVEAVLRRPDVRAAVEKALRAAVSRAEFVGAERLKKALDKQAARAAKMHKDKLSVALAEQARLEEELEESQTEARNVNAALQRTTAALQAAAGKGVVHVPVVLDDPSSTTSAASQQSWAGWFNENAGMEIFSVSTEEQVSGALRSEEQITVNRVEKASAALLAEHKQLQASIIAERKQWEGERTELLRQVRNAEARATAADARAESATAKLIDIKFPSSSSSSGGGLSSSSSSSSKPTRSSKPKVDMTTERLQSHDLTSGGVSERIANYEHQAGGATKTTTTASSPKKAIEQVASSPPPTVPPVYFEDEDAEEDFRPAPSLGDANGSLAALLADMEATTRKAGLLAGTLVEREEEEGEAC